MLNFSSCYHTPLPLIMEGQFTFPKDKLHIPSSYHTHLVMEGQVTFPLQPYPTGYRRTSYTSHPATTPTLLQKDMLLYFTQFLLSCCPPGSLEFWVRSTQENLVQHISFFCFVRSTINTLLYAENLQLSNNHHFYTSALTL